MKNTYNAIDLFSGAGGLHIGFEKAGFGIKLCIDNDNLVERTHVRMIAALSRKTWTKAERI